MSRTPTFLSALALALGLGACTLDGVETTSDGQLMSYKLHHRRTGSQLLDNQTFAQANVVDGDELRLQPEITAGLLPSLGLPAPRECPLTNPQK